MTSGQKNGVLVAVAVVALGAAGILFFRAGSAASTALPTTAGIHGVCLSCKAESAISVPLSDHDPYACPKCNTRSLYPLYFCTDCMKRFVPQLSRPAPGEPLRVPMSVLCPSCRGGNSVPFDAESIPADMVKGDLPLPNWAP